MHTMDDRYLSVNKASASHSRGFLSGRLANSECCACHYTKHRMTDITFHEQQDEKLPTRNSISLLSRVLHKKNTLRRSQRRQHLTTRTKGGGGQFICNILSSNSFSSPNPGAHLFCGNRI